MDFKGIGTGISTTLTSALGKVQGVIFSTPDLAGAAEKFLHAMQGETYTPSVGVNGEFDTNSQDGRAYISETRHKLLDTIKAYDKAHSKHVDARQAEDVLTEDYGIDVTQLIIDAQPAQAIIHGNPTQNSENSDVDHDDMRM